MPIAFVAHAFYYTAVSYPMPKLAAYILIAKATGFTPLYGKDELCCYLDLSDYNAHLPVCFVARESIGKIKAGDESGQGGTLFLDGLTIRVQDRDLKTRHWTADASFDRSM